MKSIISLSYGDTWKKDQPSSNPNYAHIEENYKAWSILAKKRKIDFLRASIKWYDVKRGVFTKYWQFNGQRWIKVRKLIKPTAVFDKTHSSKRAEVSILLYKMIKKGIKVFNPPAFRDQVQNKMTDFMYWSEEMPPSIIVHNKKWARRAAVAFFADKRFVAKELFGSGGKNVYIGTFDKIPFTKLNYPILLQSFVKSTGVPLYKGTVSDLRLEYINHKVVAAYTRVASDSLFTNTNKGADIYRYPVTKIPKEVKQMAKRLQEQIKHFEFCHYAFDFFFTKKFGVRFIESGTVPGVGGVVESKADKQWRERYLTKLTDAILRVKN